ncbi:MAG: hypothetical protein ACT4QF_07485 [Sporichthyaceae bacterium]
MHRNLNRAATVAAILGLSFTAGTAAFGAATTRATQVQVVQSASWGLTPLVNDSATAPDLTWSVSEQTFTSPKFFRVVNTGNANLLGATWNVTTNNILTPNFRFAVCTVPWYVNNTENNGQHADGTCQGSNQGTTLGPTAGIGNGGSFTSTTVPAAPGAVLYVRMFPDKLRLGTPYTATLSIRVSSATQIQKAVKTVNS